MAFCGNCGAHSEGNERFCKNCGHELSAAAAAPAMPAAAAPVAPSPAPPAPPSPQVYWTPPPFPIATPVKRKKIPAAYRVAIFLLGLIALYSGLHTLGIITWPNKLVGQLTPPAGVANAALVQQQAFKSPWLVSNGDVHLGKPKWTNNANTAILAADLECDQYDQGGKDLAQKRVRLEVPNQPSLQSGQSVEYTDLDIGPSVQGLSKVNCGIMGVSVPGTNMVGTLPPPAGVANAALVQQQSFTSAWQVTNGDVHLTQSAWTNNANVSIQSVDVECDQYDQSGADQAQKQMTLFTSNQAPLPAGDGETFTDLDVAPPVQGLSKVNCGVVGVTVPPGTPGINTVGPLPPPAGVANAALVQQQTFTSQWQVTNGDLHLFNANWSNNSNTTILSANVECDQYDQNNNDQAQKHLNLFTANQTPLAAGHTETFNDVDLGNSVQGLSKVNCGVMGVKLPPATTTQ